MTQILTKNTTRYSSKSIAPELMARLDTINSHRGRLTRQANTFSNVYHHPGFCSRRWFSPTSALPHPHIIGTQDNGLKINLYILISKSKSVLHLKMNRAVWWKEAVLDEADLIGVLPNCSNDFGCRLTAPASSKQVDAIAKRLQISKPQLPRLTAYNANLLIRETILQHHLEEVMSIVDACKSNLSTKSKRVSLLPR